MRIKRLFVLIGCIILLMAGCRSTGSDDPRDTASATTSSEAYAPVTVICVVDKIEAHAYQDFITDGSVISWTLVTLMGAEGVNVRAYCMGHPFLENAPLLIGQSVSFILPPPAERDAIPLEQLEQLQRVR